MRGARLALAAVVAAAGCSFDPGGGRAATDAADPGMTDADPNAPDADPNAPDADPNAPDANPDSYTNDFSTDTMDFDFGSEDWSMGPDNLSVAGCHFSSVAAYVQNRTWTDVLVTADVRLGGGCGGLGAAAIMLRAGGTPVCGMATGYLCQIENGGAGLSITRAVSSSGCVTYLASNNQVSATSGPTYQLEFRAEGDMLTCRISGGGLPAAAMVEVQDTTNTSGTVGFGTFNDQSVFDNLVVTPL